MTRLIVSEGCTSKLAFDFDRLQLIFRIAAQTNLKPGVGVGRGGGSKGNMSSKSVSESYPEEIVQENQILKHLYMVYSPSSPTHPPPSAPV